MNLPSSAATEKALLLYLEGFTGDMSVSQGKLHLSLQSKDGNSSGIEHIRPPAPGHTGHLRVHLQPHTSVFPSHQPLSWAHSMPPA